MIYYLLLNLAIHLGIALLLPLSNDEAYYWEWGQSLQWSYFDHPPGVSWMTALASSLATGKLGVRLLPPFLHTLLLWINFKVLERNPSSGRESLSTDQKRLFLLMLSTPGLLIMGSLTLPDMGLWVFMQTGLLYSLILQAREKLTWQMGSLWGLSLGMAALFKYHAIPMGFGLGMSLLYLRIRKGKYEPWFFSAGFMAALVIFSPVGIWNLNNDWASFRFQAAHGFAAGNFSPRWLIQGLLACALILGPPLFFMTLKAFWPEKSWLRDPMTLLTLPSVIILLLLIAMAALRKPILPHWILPAYSLALPWLVLHLPNPSRWWRWQLVYGLGSMGLAILLFNSLTLKHIILPRLDGDPGPLSEITVWDPMMPLLKQQLHSWDDARLRPLSHCEDTLPLATYRWWGAAQLHFRFFERTPVLSLQHRDAGFYTERDKHRKRADCPLAILLTEEQWARRAGLENIDVMDKVELVIPQHEKQSWFLVLGRWVR